MKNLYLQEKRLTKQDNFRLARQMRSGDVKARERMISGNAGFAYKRAIKYAMMNSRWGHIEDDDILQSAMMGLVEAVDRYDPETGYSFTTYAHFWISKRISEEIASSHWRGAKPPRQAMRKFLYGKMDEEESADYVRKFMNSSAPVDMPRSGSEDDSYITSEIMDAVGRAGLTEIETSVFNHLYVDGEEIEMSQKDISTIEDSIMEKLRGQFS